MRWKQVTGGDVTCKQFRPGDEGFDEIAAQVTPLRKIKPPFGRVWGTWGDVVPAKSRLETMDKLR